MGEVQPLMEVFQIIYLGHDDIEPEDQDGTIKLISDDDIQYLYEYDEHFVNPNQPSIKCGDQIMVTIDSPTIRRANIDIEFDLFRGAYKGTLKVDWQHIGPGYPKLYAQKIHSQDGIGEIAVLYGLFPSARVADIQVELLDDTVKDIYGLVAASNSDLQRDLLFSSSILFSVDADNPESIVDPELTLSKSSVAVPLNADLYVHLCLNCDGTDYKDKLCFEHKEAGKSVKVDRSNKIQVEVTWGV